MLKHNNVFFSFGNEANWAPCRVNFPIFNFQMNIQENRLPIFCSWTMNFMSITNDNYVIF